MGININKPHLWKQDIIKSVDFYNNWFLDFAPKAFKETRKLTSKRVESALMITNYLRSIDSNILKKYPEILPILRMSTCPPIARDRLVGLSGASKGLITSMEKTENPRIPPKMNKKKLTDELNMVSKTILKLIDVEIFNWLLENREPNNVEIMRSSTVIADRLCGTEANPIIRNAQEKRQLASIENILFNKGYTFSKPGTHFKDMTPGTFSFHTNIPVDVSRSSTSQVNIPVDIAIMPFEVKHNKLPLLIEAKSAGDFTNVNKRRKEEAVKMQQLKDTYGDEISYTLFLCGYFNASYLGYEAAEGIDWIWEHRISDLNLLGI